MSLIVDTAQSVSALPRRLLDLVLPPRCLVCGERVPLPGELCATCWSGLQFLTPPWCRCCGRPMSDAIVAEPLCGECRDHPPVFSTARAALRYDGVARRLILGFKHHDRIEGVASMASWMARMVDGGMRQSDLVVPVPLHRWRLMRRGFNQSALLAGRIAREASLPLAIDLLRRARPTASQQGLGAAERRRNVTAEVFEVAPRWRQRIAGAHVLLIDDVLTTGATASACAAAMLRAGAKRVDVLALARVVQDEDDLISEPIDIA